MKNDHFNDHSAIWFVPHQVLQAVFSRGLYEILLILLILCFESRAQLFFVYDSGQQAGVLQLIKNFACLDFYPFLNLSQTFKLVQRFIFAKCDLLID